jgi:hypothetical protein
MSGDAKVFLVRIFDGYGVHCSFQSKANLIGFVILKIKGLPLK